MWRVGFRFPGGGAVGCDKSAAMEYWKGRLRIFYGNVFECKNFETPVADTMVDLRFDVAASNSRDRGLR